MTYDDLRALVPAPAQGHDWAQCCDMLPALLRLEETPQDPYYHAEGNVGIHTRMVLDALMADAHYQRADADGRFVLFMACLLHDIAKPDTTVIDEASGRIGQPGHSRRGAVDVRVLMWKARVPFALREAVCRIIAVHQLPFHAFASRKGVRPEWLVHKLSWELSLPDLCCVARCDMLGRHYEERADSMADIALFEQLAQEEGCWEGPRQMADAHTRLAYFRGADTSPDYPLFQTAGSRVTVMCGLPASGKNHWVAQHRKGWPVVSFDDARAELGLKHGRTTAWPPIPFIPPIRFTTRRPSWCTSSSSEPALHLLHHLLHLPMPPNSLSMRFTSCTCTPAPAAMRRLRVALMSSGLRRSSGSCCG
jgi:hypothetical protein